MNLFSTQFFEIMKTIEKKSVASRWLLTVLSLFMCSVLSAVEPVPVEEQSHSDIISILIIVVILGSGTAGYFIFAAYDRKKEKASSTSNHYKLNNNNHGHHGRDRAHRKTA